MTKSSKQILLIAMAVAIATSAFIYYANSSEPTQVTLTATDGSTTIEQAEGEELSINDDTEAQGPTPEAPNAASPIAETVACLKEKGVVIYGSRTCPACQQMVTRFSGYDVIDPIYVECQSNGQRCSQEMKTQYVPEVQINGEVFKGPATPEAIATAAGCTT